MQIRRDIGLLLPGNRTVTIGQHVEGHEEVDTLVTDETLPQYRKILERLQHKQDRIESLLRATEQPPSSQRSNFWREGPRQQQQPQSETMFGGAHGDADQSSEPSDASWTSWMAFLSRDEKTDAQDNIPTAQSGDAIPQKETSTILTSQDHVFSHAQGSCEDQSFAHGFIRTCPAKDPYDYFFPQAADREDQVSPPEHDDAERLLRDNEGIRKLRASLDPADFGRFWSNVLRPGTNSTQWLASYPPILPRTEYPEEVARYVFSFMTSLWHLHGTSEMGNVIDSDFNVIGVDNLSVVDASALTRVTRMNPTATLIMMGRYVGLKKLQAWQKRAPPPHLMNATGNTCVKESERAVPNLSR